MGAHHGLLSAETLALRRLASSLALRVPGMREEAREKTPGLQISKVLIILWVVYPTQEGCYPQINKQADRGTK